MQKVEFTYVCQKNIIKKILIKLYQAQIMGNWDILILKGNHKCYM